MPGWPGCPPEIQATSEFYFWTNRQLHESKHIDSGSTSNKRFLLLDRPTVTRIKEHRFRKLKRQLSFTFVLNDSCTNQNILTPEIQAASNFYFWTNRQLHELRNIDSEVQATGEFCFWTERQLHESEDIDTGNAGVRRLLLSDRTTVT